MNWRNSGEARAQRQQARPDLSAHTDDIVHRYVVGNESCVKIGKHYGVGGETVRLRLKLAGVEMRDAGAAGKAGARAWRNVNAEREDRRIRAALDTATTYAAPDDEDHWAKADRRHVRLICRGLNGKGLPFYKAEELRI